MIDTTGNGARDSRGVMETRRYAPYGTMTQLSGINSSRFGFTGEWTDPTGLSYLRARYYAPSMGTFTALDPFEGVINRYAYVDGNPINLTDPTGLVSWRDVIDSASGAANGVRDRVSQSIRSARNTAESCAEAALVQILQGGLDALAWSSPFLDTVRNQVLDATATGLSFVNSTTSHIYQAAGWAPLPEGRTRLGAGVRAVGGAFVISATLVDSRS
ncbi:MAG: RHS repeat-associated core domain-containing protein [Deltaproteobacteria bacterium]|nr:RHS repeat-associated core domain-containing protein [Deltaproteobacteria bacterium]